jgi:tetratricopeptide (TPR) repeat protein
VAEAAVVPAVQPVAEERDAFDLAAELAGEIDTLGGAEDAAAPATEDFQYSVEEVFAEFKKGLAKVVKPEDVDTHYDLGIAYKEMGLVDDAIGEFTVARQGCLGTKREVECLTMVGMLQVMQGDAASAVTTFKEALASPHAAGEATKALGFELAMAHEAAGSAGKALYHYRRVAALDPRYREVSAQVSRLSASVQAEDDALPGDSRPAPAAAGAPKTRKVGYV